MADEKRTLEDLKDLPPPVVADEVPSTEPELDELGRSYATGKRKNAIARVWVQRGTGKITVNGRDQDVYFARPVLRMFLLQPFEAAERKGQFDVKCTVSGLSLIHI